MTDLEWFLSSMLVFHMINTLLTTQEMNKYHKSLMRYGEIIEELLSRKDRPND